MTTDGTGRSSGLASGEQWAGRPGPELPVLALGVVRERADAARNRARVLRAAQQLFAERGAAAVTMDDLAAAAGVGKGTLYRRFPDKGAVAYALLDEAERDLQSNILGGPPPLGPGDPPAERLAAFVTSYLHFAEQSLELLGQAEAGPGARLRSGAYGFWRQHCTYLLTAAGAPDPARRAEILLAALAADQIHHWLRDQQQLPTQLAHDLVAAANQLIRPQHDEQTPRGLPAASSPDPGSAR